MKSPEEFCLEFTSKLMLFFYLIKVISCFLQLYVSVDCSVGNKSHVC